MSVRVYALRRSYILTAYLPAGKCARQLIYTSRLRDIRTYGKQYFEYT